MYEGQETESNLLASRLMECTGHDANHTPSILPGMACTEGPGGYRERRSDCQAAAVDVT